MDEYLDYGLIYEFICLCGHKWHGVDVGDGFCDKCGEYSENAANTNLAEAEHG